ncbi:uncharacterized protein PHALS_10421 [Plasmopara halstedii]|uniref:Uncharacterized protein n=1 Tax=Plasmopara halstedii TaxID=4781 RepID=A0A0P1AHQ8_PLAHL|nr:uncharacterized protein PHALS_10421 [Plasmopara halstedii]CEG40209.1 hypothetical protein PHALS_10421 [Plasmopara halstedii]|eukprot:XP_024576578.1 hypothetical protein PHALS_10421 [Plasmopara halstedii]
MPLSSQYGGDPRAVNCVSASNFFFWEEVSIAGASSVVYNCFLVLVKTAFTCISKVIVG